MPRYTVIGVRFKQKKKDRMDLSKTYYYKTSADVSIGQTINIRVPDGGSPEALIVSVEQNSNKDLRKLKVWRG